jgi:hypothetical protein
MIARWSRTLRFCAGPQTHTFYACTECKPELERATLHHGLFAIMPSEPIRPVDPDDELTCDCCREGGD